MNSIEKALQRQKQKEQEQTLAKPKDDAVVSEDKVQEKRSSLEKAQEKAEIAQEANIKDSSIEARSGSTSRQSEEVPVSEDRPINKDTATVEHTIPDRRDENNGRKERYEIDLDSLEAKGHVSLRGDRRQINEEYREIKRKLLSNAFGALASTLNNPNIIMVTSARPSEGKTFTAVNLALSIAAEQDKTVLLVDADVLKPNVLRTLGLESRPGLMDYLLSDDTDIADVLYLTSVNKLRIIPAGRSHHLSTELLASQRMHETIDEFAKRYRDRVVIIDTPPLIGINESAILANFAGQAVVVVEEGKSKMRDINHAVGRLNPEMAIGFVVNKSVNADADGTGYYAYYYGEDRQDD